MNYKNRLEVPNEYKWDLTKWFVNDDAWENKFLEVSKNVDALNSYKGKLFKNNNLYVVLKKHFEYENELEKHYAYAMLKQDEDLSVSKYEKMNNKITNLFIKFEENTAFLMPEILHNEKFVVKDLIENNPDLKRYEFLLKSLENEKKYIKSEEVEKIISLLTSDINNHSILSSNLLNSDINYGKLSNENGEKIQLSSGNCAKFYESSNRKIRKSAYEKMNKQRAQYSMTLGKNLLSYMTREANIAKMRGYKSTMDMFFEGNKIPVGVYEKLVNKIHENFNIYQDFNKLLKESLNVKNLEIYDLNAPIVKNEKKYSIEDLKKYCYESSKVLGDEYASIMDKGFKENWIDFMPYKGKASGGYCLSIYGVTSNIMMNYNENFEGISTAAHEMGHAINFYYASKNNIEDSRHSNYIAEVPSLLNEILLANYVVEGNFEKLEKINVLASLLRTINSNFFGAVMESELENIVYKKLDNDEAVSVDDLNEISYNLQKDYYGDSVNLSKYSKFIWARRSHYFMPWYLYKYATCLLGAVYFASRILSGDKDVLNDYLEFIKSPNNAYPDEILKKYGINLEDDKIYEEFFEYYNSLLEKLKENMM